MAEGGYRPPSQKTKDYPDGYIPNMEGMAGLFNLLNRPHGFRRTLGEALRYFSPFSNENFWQDLHGASNTRRMEADITRSKKLRR